MASNRTGIVMVDEMSPDDIDKIRVFLKGQGKTSFFHSPEYYLSLKKNSEGKPLFLLTKTEGRITGIAIGEVSDEVSWLPYLSRRTIFYAEPLYSSLEELEIILSEISKRSKGLFCQVRPFFLLNNEELALYTKYGYKPKDHLNAFIKVTAPEQVFEGFEKDKKKGIRKAEEKFGVKIEEYSDLEKSVDSFYVIQRHLFKKKGQFIKRKEFFASLVKESGGMAKIIFATHNEVPIAAQLFLISPNRLTAFYTATLTEHREKHAGDLLIWHLIKFCHEHAIPLFDFGGGGSPTKPYPPREYKKRFGTEFQNVKRFTAPKSILYNMAMLIYSRIKNRN